MIVTVTCDHEADNKLSRVGGGFYINLFLPSGTLYIQMYYHKCVGDTHIGAASSDEADLHFKSSTGPPTSRDPHPSSLPLEAYSNTTSSILRTV